MILPCTTAEPSVLPASIGNLHATAFRDVSSASQAVGSRVNSRYSRELPVHVIVKLVPGAKVLIEESDGSFVICRTLGASQARENAEMSSEPAPSISTLADSAVHGVAPVFGL